MGKGSKQRPKFISEEELQERWNRNFSPKNNDKNTNTSTSHQSPSEGELGATPTGSPDLGCSVRVCSEGSTE